MFSLGSLQIRNSLEMDEGKYECVAENSIGIVYSYPASLYVRGTLRYSVFVFVVYGGVNCTVHQCTVLYLESSLCANICTFQFALGHRCVRVITYVM